MAVFENLRAKFPIFNSNIQSALKSMDTDSSNIINELRHIINKYLDVLESEAGHNLGEIQDSYIWTIPINQLEVDKDANPPLLGVASVHDLLDTARSCIQSSPPVLVGLWHTASVLQFLSLQAQDHFPGEAKPDIE